MISVINFNKSYLFQDLLNKTDSAKKYRPCLTIGHNSKEFPKDFTNYCAQNYIQDLRKAGECHKKVRYELQNYIKPGMRVLDICNFVENTVVKNFGENSLKQGIGFPIGYSINNIIAHDTAHVNDTRVLDKDDVVKIDYGTHVNGHIIDSAFTLAYNPKYMPLLEATKEATWNAIKMIGPDTYMNDISKEISETINSYEIELNNNLQKIKPVNYLGGHNIKPYVIHGGDLILCSPSNNPTVQQMRIKTNTSYAIETFATTGNSSYNIDENNNNLYSLKIINKNNNIKFKTDIAQKVFNYIKTTHGSLPFCSRWLYNKFGNNYKIAINELIKNDIINTYPPISDIKTSYSSQLEHTIYVHDYGKEILSHFYDY